MFCKWLYPYPTDKSYELQKVPWAQSDQVRNTPYIPLFEIAARPYEKWEKAYNNCKVQLPFVLVLMKTRANTTFTHRDWAGIVGTVGSIKMENFHTDQEHSTGEEILILPILHLFC